MPDLRIEGVVVTGGRKFTDGARIEADLRALLPFGLRRVAQGGNGLDEQLGGGEVPDVIRSADTLAALAAAGLQLDGATYRVNRAPDERGTWTHQDGDGKRAPLNRNIRMLEAERPDLVLAYPDPGSRGTWHCVAEALKRGIWAAVWAPEVAPGLLAWERGAAAMDYVAVAMRAAGLPPPTMTMREDIGRRVVVAHAPRHMDARALLEVLCG